MTPPTDPQSLQDLDDRLRQLFLVSDEPCWKRAAQRLLDQGASFNRWREGERPLLVELMGFDISKHIPLLAWALRHGAVADPSPHHVTPLYRAVSQDAVDSALLLLAHGADPNVRHAFLQGVDIRSDTGRKVLEVALRRTACSPLLVQRLLEAGAQMPEAHETPPSEDVLVLHLIRKKDDPDPFKHLVAHGVDVRVRTRDPNARNALHVAALQGHTRLVRFFLEQGFDPFEPDAGGEQAVSMARRRKHAHTHELLQSWTSHAQLQADLPTVLEPTPSARTKPRL
jgi:ankyrin repeat protein